MTTRRSEGREAITDYRVTRKIETPWGKFSLVVLNIHTGRTHQIRVHMSSLGHPVVATRFTGHLPELRDASGSRRRPVMRIWPAVAP